MKKLIITLIICFLPISIQAKEVGFNSDGTISNSAISNSTIADPFESYNRAIFKFNNAFNDLIAEDIANMYLNYVPSPAQRGLSNFFDNLKEPLNMANSFLQGNIEGGLTSIMRFSLNSTFGLLGLIDIATLAGLDRQKEDFAQTLYVWGVWRESSFIMLPILGPSTVREFVGNVADGLYDPIYTHLIETSTLNLISMSVTDKFIGYTQVIHLIDKMNQQADPYIFLRESYLQHRKNLIYNGNPPQPQLDDFDFD